MPEPFPRHMGLGALLKTVAASTQLSSSEVKAVLDEVLSIIRERYANKFRVHLPPALLRE